MMNIRKIPLQIILIFVISLLPVVLGSLLYFQHHYFHFKKLNHGTLFSVPIDVKDLWMDEMHDRKWHVVYMTDGVCDEHCTQVIHQLQQVQKALGKNRERIRVMSLQGPVIALDQKLTPIVSRDFVTTNKIYLIDPIGNLLMYYPHTTDPMNVYRDLQRLLEASQIG